MDIPILLVCAVNGAVRACCEWLIQSYPRLIAWYARPRAGVIGSSISSSDICETRDPGFPSNIYTCMFDISMLPWMVKVRSLVIWELDLLWDSLWVLSTFLWGPVYQNMLPSSISGACCSLPKVSPLIQYFDHYTKWPRKSLEFLMCQLCCRKKIFRTETSQETFPSHTPVLMLLKA